jgi:hypothetical protein
MSTPPKSILRYWGDLLRVHRGLKLPDRPSSPDFKTAHSTVYPLCASALPHRFFLITQLRTRTALPCAVIALTEFNPRPGGDFGRYDLRVIRAEFRHSHYAGALNHVLVLATGGRLVSITEMHIWLLEGV